VPFIKMYCAGYAMTIIETHIVNIGNFMENRPTKVPNLFFLPGNYHGLHCISKQFTSLARNNFDVQEPILKVRND